MRLLRRGVQQSGMHGWWRGSPPGGLCLSFREPVAMLGEIFGFQLWGGGAAVLQGGSKSVNLEEHCRTCGQTQKGRPDPEGPITSSPGFFQLFPEREWEPGVTSEQR